MLRQLETETAAEMARLDDKAKEEKLKQIAAVEKAYQVCGARGTVGTHLQWSCTPMSTVAYILLRTIYTCILT